MLNTYQAGFKDCPSSLNCKTSVKNIYKKLIQLKTISHRLKAGRKSMCLYIYLYIEEMPYLAITGAMEETGKNGIGLI